MIGTSNLGSWNGHWPYVLVNVFPEANPNLVNLHIHRSQAKPLPQRDLPNVSWKKRENPRRNPRIFWKMGKNMWFQRLRSCIKKKNDFYLILSTCIANWVSSVSCCLPWPIRNPKLTTGGNGSDWNGSESWWSDVGDVTIAGNTTGQPSKVRYVKWDLALAILLSTRQ